MADGIAIFTDLIEAAGRLASTIKGVAAIPRNERDKIRSMLEETYRLIDSTLNMVIFRLGDVLAERDDFTFLEQARQLGFDQQWYQAEREFRLCRSLRVTLSEAESLAGRWSVLVGPQDWGALVSQMQAILRTEADLATVISDHFHQISEEAWNATGDPVRTAALRTELAKLREELANARRRLMQQEIDLYALV